MLDEPVRTSRLTITCLDGEKCIIYFEPWGTEHILSVGEIMYVDSPAIASGHVEVAYTDGGIVLAFTVDAPVRISNAAGQELKL